MSIGIKGINNTVQTSSVNSNQQTKVKNLVKYVNNEALKDTPDTFISTLKGSGSGVALFEGIPLLNLLFRNKKLGKKFSNEAMQNLGQVNKEALKNLIKGEGSFKTRLGKYIESANNSKATYEGIKSTVKKEYKLEKLTQKAKKAIEKAAAKPNSKLAKKAATKATDKAFEKAIKMGTEETAKKAAETGIKHADKLGKFGKFMKTSGASTMLIFSGIIEGFTEILPTFRELGFAKGIKQIGKSAIKVAGDTAGYIAGQQIGVSVGTAIGTAICPGIGSAIGAAVGFVGGLAGSFIAGKVTKAITGKSEREKAKEAQEQQKINDIANNEQSVKDLENIALDKIKQEMVANNGKLSEDSQMILDMLNEQSNPFAA